MDGYGLDAQLAAIAQYATNAGLTLIAVARDEMRVSAAYCLPTSGPA